ncbi:MAG: gliding motility-associated C-terminal domain-containing protein [Elusimicrobiota bacterium]|nr:gliding motility-associated C-terminal domain-containing protein [Elusimicrobiota bacterium]
MAGLLKPFALLMTLAAGVFASGLRPTAFTFSGVVNRFVTPNGDGRNDTATFQFSNPRDSGGTLKVFDLRGHKVAEVEIQPTVAVTSSVSWAPSTTIPSGVYVYVITIEQQTVTGAVVVVR